MDSPSTSLTFWQQVAWLLVLSVPIACVSWTVSHEEILREAREYCAERSRRGGRLLVRKFFYVPTCEYCFSHYVALGFQILTGYKLLLDDWRGYVIGFFALVAIANVYMSAFGRLRVNLKAERARAAAEQGMADDGWRSPALSDAAAWPQPAHRPGTRPRRWPPESPGT